MPIVTVEVVPGAPGRPAQIKLNSDLDPPEAIVLLERAKAVLLTQPVRELDGEPQTIQQAPPGLAQRLINGRG